MKAVAHIAWKLFGVLLAAIVVLTGVYEHGQVAMTNHPATIAALPQPGYQMPPISLSEYPSGSVTPSSLRGKPVFINFWASWCTYCRLEAPDIVAAHKKYGNKVVFLTINATAQDNFTNAEAFMKKFGISWPVPLDKSGKVASEYHIVALPASFFVNRKGMIVAANLGPLSNQTLNSELERIAQ